MADQGEEETKDKLKSALWYSIGNLTTQESTHLNKTATPQFIGTLTEMVWSQIETISQDLHTFSAHAGRTTVNSDDVLLICRRNEVLEEIMREFIDHLRVEKEGRKNGGGSGGKDKNERGKAKGGGVKKSGGKGKGKGRKGSV